MVVDRGSAAGRFRVLFGPVSHDRPDRSLFGLVLQLFCAELCLIDILGLGLAVAIGHRVSPRRWWLLPWVYTLVTVAQPHLLYDRLDLGLLCFFLLFVYCRLKSLEAAAAATAWDLAGYLTLGLGISFKIMPVVFAPFLLLADWRARGGSSRFASCCLLLFLGAIGPFLLEMASAGWSVLRLFQYHGERDIHLESLWASIVLLAAKFGLPCQIVFSHGGFDLSSPWSGALKTVSSVALVAMASFFGLWALWLGKRFDRRVAFDTAYLVLINAVVLAKVYSPQYLTWTVPLALLLALDVFPPRRLAWGGFAALVVLIVGISAWIFPHHYPKFLALEALPVDLLITRSACLVALAFLLNVAFFCHFGLAPWGSGPTRSADESQTGAIGHGAGAI